MNYQETLAYLYSQLPMFQRIGAAAYKNNLDNTIALCNTLNNPQKKIKSIHIAGTNGKGSVSHYTASILQEQGFKVGLYTSPHLKDFRERIKINGKKIPESRVVKFVESYQYDFEKIKPSFFEYTFGMAIDYFAMEKIDIAVMETGMGGRLDSTNVVNSIISVITNIGMDHTQFLGNTLPEIAIEKAGIIKNKVPVVIGETQDEVRSIFEGKASECNTDITFADQCFSIDNVFLKENSCSELIIKSQKDSKKIRLLNPLLGSYQEKNIITTLAILDELNKSGFNISDDKCHEGILKVVENTGVLGRWQILNKKPLTICDTGHNVDGIKHIVKQLAQQSYQKLHFVIGTVDDKNIDSILQLLPQNAKYYFCKANIPRGLDQEKLKEKAGTMGLTGHSFTSVSEAYLTARQKADKDDMIFIGGSTFVVAELL